MLPRQQGKRLIILTVFVNIYCHRQNHSAPSKHNAETIGCGETYSVAEQAAEQATEQPQCVEDTPYPLP